uniref:Protein kinase domain-containing protein n=1 Tax=Macrostomum lignano TaxID=282301 RepID=A0A1I8FD13_9PLAT
TTAGTSAPCGRPVCGPGGGAPFKRQNCRTSKQILRQSRKTKGLLQFCYLPPDVPDGAESGWRPVAERPSRGDAGRLQHLFMIEENFLNPKATVCWHLGSASATASLGWMPAVAVPCSAVPAASRGFGLIKSALWASGTSRSQRRRAVRVTAARQRQSAEADAQLRSPSASSASNPSAQPTAQSVHELLGGRCRFCQLLVPTEGSPKVAKSKSAIVAKRMRRVRETEAEETNWPTGWRNTGSAAGMMSTAHKMLEALRALRIVGGTWTRWGVGGEKWNHIFEKFETQPGRGTFSGVRRADVHFRLRQSHRRSWNGQWHRRSRRRRDATSPGVQRGRTTVEALETPQGGPPEAVALSAVSSCTSLLAPPAQPQQVLGPLHIVPQNFRQAAGPGAVVFGACARVPSPSLSSRPPPGSNSGSGRSLPYRGGVRLRLVYQHWRLCIKDFGSEESSIDCLPGQVSMERRIHRGLATKFGIGNAGKVESKSLIGTQTK